ncbi:MAG: hypothetical protein AB7Q17_15945, partial [Phycisphaerae bacterium]
MSPRDASAPGAAAPQPPGAAPAPGRAAALLLSPWLAALVGACCYLNTLSHGFTYDDGPIVQRNPVIRSLANAEAIWLSDWWGAATRAELDLDDPRRDRLYRPLTLFTFALQYALHGLAPAGFHAVNVALHALCAALVVAFVRRLLDDRVVAAVSGALFAVHPVHCEAVANIVGRAEVLAALFLLLGLVILLPRTGPPGWGRCLAAALMFFGALLAKETAVSYWPIALLAMHGAGRLPWRGAAGRWMWTASVLLLPLAAYLPLRYVALGGHLLRDRAVDPIFNPIVVSAGPARLAAPLTVAGHYVRLLLVPDALVSDYGYAAFDPQAGANGLTVLGGAAVVALGVLLGGYRRHAGVWRSLAVGAAIALASYALISNTALLIGVSLAERLMYWPSVPLLMLIATAAVAAWRKWCAPGAVLAGTGALLRIAGGLLLAALALRAVVRNIDWANNFTLFEADVATAPRSFTLNRAFAREILVFAAPRTDDPRRDVYLQRAERYVQAALRISPREADALNLYAYLHSLRGDVEAARAYAQAAIDVFPGHRLSKQLLASLSPATPEMLEQIAALQAALAEKEDPAARVELTRLLLTAGRHRDALAAIEPLARGDSRDVAALQLYAELLTLTEQEAHAIEVFRRVLTLAPDDWSAHSNLANLLAEHDAAAAHDHARAAHRLRPDDLRGNMNQAES